jgi:site-specific recombinase XerD
MAGITTRALKANIDKWKDLLFSFNHQESGVKSNVRDVTMLLRFTDEKKYSSITGETLLEFITWLKAEQGNSAGAINRKISSIKSYIRHLRFLRVKGADTLPIKELPRCREPYSGPIQALEPEEVQKILRAIDTSSVIGYRDYVFYSLIYNLGLRVSEAVGISISDIDFEKEIITIHGKGGKRRIIPIVNQLITMLDKWITFRKKLMNAHIQDALFISKKGKRLAIRTAQDNFKKYVEKAGKLSLSKVTPHSLRHAFATHALESESELLVLKTILGHARLETTEIYLHPSINIMRKAMNDHLANDILGGILENKTDQMKINNRRCVIKRKAA